MHRCDAHVCSDKGRAMCTLAGCGGPQGTACWLTSVTINMQIVCPLPLAQFLSLFLSSAASLPTRQYISIMRLDLVNHIALSSLYIAGASALTYPALIVTPVDRRSHTVAFPSYTHPSSHTQHAREDTETQTLAATATTLGSSENTTASDSATTTQSYNLVTASTPIALAATMGLIMPNPWRTLYTDLEYSFGFIDAVSQPAPTYGGWIRQVTPLMILSNHTVDVFTSSGTDDPTSVDAIPEGSDGLCGATVEKSAVAYSFKFEEPGWYMFVVNQTYMQANVTSNNQCTRPILQQDSFFATQTFSISPRPIWSPGPQAPTSAYTVWAAVTTSTPGNLPYDEQPMSKSQKLGVALGAAGGVLGVAFIVAVVWWVRNKRKMESETLAFSRLTPQAQEEFLRDNPKSFLNPNHPRYARNNAYGGAPAPPGTIAHGLWYSQQLWNHQVMQRPQAPWGAGVSWGSSQPMASTGMMPSQQAYGQHQIQQPLMDNSRPI
ncbi:hypothetical protein L202_01296 [Cryptococcus amylolentus CBS 6039]|uniref:Uncharacterized protein n=1 Tax=Cryptococcus amylolentus CBS 6039 TaxID=1295533 RepID=A0A1E3I388_9TREE|nr:hypothetical protein L202_01296 [Cryptococcus amylolentus CBS 6039]ODN83074.1 hypothetical protein L202_01296 [Cryptococcus amylolentus CBS 6039]